MVLTVYRLFNGPSNFLASHAAILDNNKREAIKEGEVLKSMMAQETWSWPAASSVKRIRLVLEYTKERLKRLAQLKERSEDEAAEMRE